MDYYSIIRYYAVNFSLYFVQLYCIAVYLIVALIHLQYLQICSTVVLNLYIIDLVQVLNALSHNLIWNSKTVYPAGN